MQENYAHQSDGLSATSIVVCNCNTSQCNSNNITEILDSYVMVAISLIFNISEIIDLRDSTNEILPNSIIINKSIIIEVQREIISIFKFLTKLVRIEFIYIF